MTNDILEALERSLQEKLDSLGRLVRLAEVHREALVSNNIDELLAVSQEQTTALSELDRLQRSSSQMMSRIGSELGLSQQDSSLSAIAGALPEEYRVRLEKLSEGLMSEASRLAMASEINASLSSNALEFIRFSLQAVNDAQANSPEVSGNEPGSLLVNEKA